MTGSDFKAELQLYLQRGRDALLWKLDGASEYDVRRPMTPTGTNLLGLVKHVTAVEAGYFGETFGRPFGEPTGWTDRAAAEENGDLWARADESREQITGQYQRVWAHADQTIAELPLDAAGHVPWWPPEHNEVTLHRVLVHVIAETERHAGHADIIRETIDGTVGIRPGSTNMASDDSAWWDRYRATLERVARQAGGVSG